VAAWMDRAWGLASFFLIFTYVFFRSSVCFSHLLLRWGVVFPATDGPIFDIYSFYWEESNFGVLPAASFFLFLLFFFLVFFLLFFFLLPEGRKHSLSGIVFKKINRHRYEHAHSHVHVT